MKDTLKNNQSPSPSVKPESPENQVVEIVNEYVPNKKGIIFHTSPAKFKFLRGAMGAGKSRMAVEELKTLMMEYPGIPCGVFRKTMPALRDTTMKEFLQFMPQELGRLNARVDTYTAINKATCIFRGFDEPAKFKSLNLSVIIMDEAEEFDFVDFQTLLSRLRARNPNPRGKPWPLVIIVIFNPVDESHWIYKQVVENKTELEKNGGLLDLQLSTFDNEENLPAGYISQLQATMTADEQNRYIHGNWGRIQRGLPVYSDVFSRELHVRNMEYREGFVLQRGWDFGFNNPACVIRFKDEHGRKHIYREIMGNKERLDVFAPKVLEVCERLFGPYVVFQDYCDPRGFDKTDKGSTSVEILNDHGVYPVGERGVRNYVEPGVKLVRQELSTLTQGIPNLTVSPECQIFINGFSGAYEYDENGQPKKDGYYDHLFDALRYIAYMDKSNNAVKEAIWKRKTIRKPRNAYTGY